MRQRTFLFLEVQNIFEIAFITIRDAVGTFVHGGMVFFGYGGKALESVEGHHFAQAVEGLVNAPQGAEDGTVLAPAASEIDDIVVLETWVAGKKAFDREDLKE